MGLRVASCCLQASAALCETPVPPERKEWWEGGWGRHQVTLPLVWAATGLGAAVTVSRKPALEGQGGPGKAGFLLDKHSGRSIYRCSRYRVGLLVG